MRSKPTLLLKFFDSNKQQERFEKVYGKGDYAATISKNAKRTVWLFILLLLFIIVLMVLERSKSHLTYQGIDFDGNGNIVSVLRPASEDETIVLKADIITDSGEPITKNGVKIVIAPLQTEAQKKNMQTNRSTDERDDVAQQEIRKVVYQLNSNTAQRKVTFPKVLNNGTKINWVPIKSNDGWIGILVLLIGGSIIFLKRDAGLVKAEKDARESVLRELPEFVNKLVLLLNAGLITNSAIQKIVSDFNKNQSTNKSYFYIQMSAIMSKCNETNAAFLLELRSFAVRTGVVEFMRIANVINDSMTKGADLMTQLKMEGDNLWAARRKQIEEKGKLAETKLTLPLVILLLVLLMITIAPAMMEM